MTRRPVIFGEIVFDRFPDGRTVLGGAPFNVAWHLAAFGQRPLTVSAVGDDEPGARILDRMDEQGMETSAVAIDTTLPTGAVDVTFDDGEPHYEIVRPVAWDAIPAPGWPGDGGLLYHGTLARRSEPSGQALGQLRSVAGEAGAGVFVDVNLRDPWWNRDAVLHDLSGAHWAKLNEAELALLASESEGPLPARASAFATEHALEGLLVTRGPEGALAVEQGGRITLSDPPPEVHVVDTVGAGDAFTAVFLLGQLRGWPVTTTLERALAFAAEICTLRGATPDDPSFYVPFLAAWNA